jgi:hypothetical protein
MEIKTVNICKKIPMLLLALCCSFSITTSAVEGLDTYKQSARSDHPEPPKTDRTLPSRQEIQNLLVDGRLGQRIRQEISYLKDFPNLSVYGAYEYQEKNLNPPNTISDFTLFCNFLKESESAFVESIHDVKEEAGIGKKREDVMRSTVRSDCATEIDQSLSAIKREMNFFVENLETNLKGGPLFSTIKEPLTRLKKDLQIDAFLVHLFIEKNRIKDRCDKYDEDDELMEEKGEEISKRDGLYFYPMSNNGDYLNLIPITEGENTHQDSASMDSSKNNDPNKNLPYPLINRALIDRKLTKQALHDHEIAISRILHQFGQSWPTMRHALDKLTDALTLTER